MTDANVILWGRRIGAVSWDETRSLGVFQYDPAFVGAGIDVAPLKMPAREAPYEFPALNRESFRGLPGMLADALPDRRGGIRRKLHMQTLGAMQHFDFNDPAAYSYEQAVMTIRELGLGMMAVEEQFRRALFNVVARNQDDHVKNISFLMDRSGKWTLSPAYDVAYAYNPRGAWTRDHQMSLAGRRNGFERDDILEFAASTGVKKRKALRILDEVSASVRDWGKHIEAAGVSPRDVARIEKAFRSHLMSGR